MRDFLLAFQFLTIVPVRVPGKVSENDVARSAAFFPVIGAIQGALACLSAFLLLKIFPPEITGGLIILILILSNGGFHIDGLADTFDALAVKSQGDVNLDIKKRLSVMKDSSTGAIGVVAIVISILLKYLFIRNLLLNAPVFTACSMLFLMPVFSKWIMVPAMYHGASARQDGLGRIFLGGIKGNTVILSSLLLIAILIMTAELHLVKTYGAASVKLFAALLPTLYLFNILSVRHSIKKFGGLTGDNFGAISEISEILFLSVTTIWLQHFI